MKKSRLERLRGITKFYTDTADVFKKKAKYSGKWVAGSEEYGEPKDDGHEDDELGGSPKQPMASTKGLKQPTYTAPTLKQAGT